MKKSVLIALTILTLVILVCPLVSAISLSDWLKDFNNWITGKQIYEESKKTVGCIDGETRAGVCSRDEHGCTYHETCVNGKWDGICVKDDLNCPIEEGCIGERQEFQSGSNCCSGLKWISQDCAPGEPCPYSLGYCTKCGDGVCATNEICEQDCGPLVIVCNDKICEAGETPQNCPQDCKKTCERDSDCEDNNPETVEFCKTSAGLVCPPEGCEDVCIYIPLYDISCEKVYEGTFPNKINFVFIADGYTLDHNEVTNDVGYDFQILNPYREANITFPVAKFDTHISNFDKFVEYEMDENGIGLFGIEPYKSYKNRFDVYKLSSDIEWASIGIRLPQVYEPLIEVIQKKCEISEEIIMGSIVDNNFFALRLGYFPISTTFALSKTTTAHEVGGHSISPCYDSSPNEFFGLQDEYFQYTFVFKDLGFRDGAIPSSWLDSKLNINSLLKCNIDTEGCPKWCDGNLNQLKLCYPYYMEWKDCVISSTENWNGDIKDWYFGPFKDCWENEAYKYFQETGMSLEECELGSNCIEGTDCVWLGNSQNPFFTFKQSKDTVINQINYAFGFEKVNPKNGVYYTSPTEISLVPEDERAEIIAKPCAPIGSDMQGMSPVTREIEWRCSYTPESGLIDKSWWTVKWKHLDTEGCPKWCEGLDINSECYSYYIEFKNCAEDLFSNIHNRKLGLHSFVDASSCWNTVAGKYKQANYKQANGKNLKEGCAIGLNCKEGAECIWPGGGHWNPYATFRKNKEFPYWGYGVYSEKLIKEKIEFFTSSVAECNTDSDCTIKCPTGQQSKCQNNKCICISITECELSCLYDTKCIPYGMRINNNYCDLSGQMLNQKSEGAFCENNFECNSNICINNKCISETLWNRFLEWFNLLFRRR